MSNLRPGGFTENINHCRDCVSSFPTRGSQGEDSNGPLVHPSNRLDESSDGFQRLAATAAVPMFRLASEQRFESGSSVGSQQVNIRANTVQQWIQSAPAVKADWLQAV